MRGPFDSKAGMNQSAVIGSSGAARTKTIEAVAGEHHVLRSVSVSYSAGTPGGKLTITFGGVTTFEVDVENTGQQDILFDYGHYTGINNEEVLVTLAAVGSAIATVTVTWQ